MTKPIRFIRPCGHVNDAVIFTINKEKKVRIFCHECVMKALGVEPYAILTLDEYQKKNDLKKSCGHIAETSIPLLSETNLVRQFCMSCVVEGMLNHGIQPCESYTPPEFKKKYSTKQTVRFIRDCGHINDATYLTVWEDDIVRLFCAECVYEKIGVKPIETISRQELVRKYGGQNQ